MPRTARVSVGGVCYHVGNRGNGRRHIEIPLPVLGYGEAALQRKAAQRLGLESTLRPRGHQRKRLEYTWISLFT